jgi:hypothetical protein
MKKSRLSIQENFLDDGSIAAEINRKLNFGEANKPCFFCELKSQYYFKTYFFQISAGEYSPEKMERAIKSLYL